MAVAPAQRRCLACGHTTPIAAGEPVFPIGARCEACGHEVAQRDGVPLYAPELADTLTGMDPASFQVLFEVEARHFWFRSRARLIIGMIDQLFPQARRFLEIGCGKAAVLEAIAGARRYERVAGSELHTAALAFARQRMGAGPELVQMDARAIPARSAFDLIGAFDVLEHIEDDQAVLREIHAALVPGGGVIVTVPQHPRLWSAADDIAFHVRRYRRGEMEQKLTAAGFRVVRSTSYTALLLPLFALSRLVRKTKPKTTDEFAAAEFHISAPVNAVLHAITALEVSLTLAGVSWPAGGSRVVVAVRP
jgi:SAM-dependent methyltransferase